MTVPLKIVIPDLISPSYFPLIAAVELGCIKARGVETELSLHFPVTSSINALRKGEVDLVGGSVHALFHEAPDGGGVRILAALSHNMYWFLVARADRGLTRGADLSNLKGLRIGAAPGPDAGLVQMLLDAGVDPATVEIGPVPGATSAGASFGVAAAKALAAGHIDGFWANGMGAEVAVREGTGTVVVDARRGDGPAGTANYTFAALLCSAELEASRPDDAKAAVAGLVEAQQRLRAEPAIATDIAKRLFPPMEAELTATLIERDAPFYDPAIDDAAFDAMVAFARRRGFTNREFEKDELVSTRFRQLWRSAP